MWLLCAFCPAPAFLLPIQVNGKDHPEAAAHCLKFSLFRMSLNLAKHGWNPALAGISTRIAPLLQRGSFLWCGFLTPLQQAAALIRFHLTSSRCLFLWCRDWGKDRTNQEPYLTRCCREQNSLEGVHVIWESEIATKQRCSVLFLCRARSTFALQDFMAR